MSIHMERLNEHDWDQLQQQLDQLSSFVRAPKPNCRVFNTPAQVIPTGAITVLTLNTEVWDVGDIHSTVANTNRFTAPITGLYAISGSGGWAPAAGGTIRQLEVRDSAAARLVLCRVGPVGAVLGPSNNVYVEVRLVKGDWVEFAVFQDSGGNLGFGDAATSAAFAVNVHRISGYNNEGVA